MILLIGHGSIGKRYSAILDYLNQPYRIKEINDPYDFSGITKVIIASPTDQHGSHCYLANEVDLPFLCEKPLTKNPIEAEEISRNCMNGFVVNNYAHILSENIEMIDYDFFNTGKDGLIWDCCQLVYLAYLKKAKLSLKRESFYWSLQTERRDVSYREIEWSYLRMIKDFLIGDYKNLWTLSQGAEMTKICDELTEKAGRNCEAINWSSSSDTFKSFTKKDLSDNRGESIIAVGL